VAGPVNPRKPYPEEFKREAVDLLRTSGRPLAQIARELGVSVESLRLWRKQGEIDAGENEGLSSEEREIDAGENEGLSSEEREKPRRPHHAVKQGRNRIWVSMAVAVVAVTAAVVFLVVPLVGRGGDDGPDAGKAQQAAGTEPAIHGSFVGEVSGTNAFVAVVAAPAEGDDGSAILIYVSDGRRLSEWFSGPISDNSFVAMSDDSDAEIEGTLSGDSVTGTVALPGGETVRYEASPPSGAAGLYELTVSSAGELSGASAAGLGVTGEITLGKRGTGMLWLVDGKRLEFAVSRTPVGALAHLRAGQVRLIVLPDGELRGAGKGRPSGGGGADFFLRSA
jgi:transposase-like protein